MLEGKGSRQQDLHGEEMTMRFTCSRDSKLKDCSFSPVKIKAFVTGLHMRVSKTDRIWEILEIKISLNISGILSKGTLFGRIHFLPYPYKYFRNKIKKTA